MQKLKCFSTIMHVGRYVLYAPIRMCHVSEVTIIVTTVVYVCTCCRMVLQTKVSYAGPQVTIALKSTGADWAAWIQHIESSF